ncbi:polygalacturonase isoform X3 [Senna tora]|uniref:Polygalacturonase isoform X3 n=1 Tax=Senna tora TaxID=362788 RepID=A0A834WTB8_9FABA|nr:polygalacturonase isoform X3 [Senna tora]
MLLQPPNSTHNGSRTHPPNHDPESLSAPPTSSPPSLSSSISPRAPSKVKISKVEFKNIRGTFATPNGVSLICSSGIPCEDAKLSEIDLTFNGAPTTAKCSNVKPIIVRKAPKCTAYNLSRLSLAGHFFHSDISKF